MPGGGKPGAGGTVGGVAGGSTGVGGGGAKAGESSSGASGSHADPGSGSGSGGAAGNDAGGEGGSSAGASGQGGAPAEPTCIDEPLTADEEVCRLLGAPSGGECSEQDPGGWMGCYNGNCQVCTKSVVDYPYYFDWHPCCKANTTCGSNDPVFCNSLCPPPTEREKIPPCFRVALEP